MAAPLVEGGQEILNGLLHRPEVAVQHGHVGDRPGTLSGHQLFDGRVPRQKRYGGSGAISDGRVVVKCPHWTPRGKGAQNSGGLCLDPSGLGLVQSASGQPASTAKEVLRWPQNGRSGSKTSNAPNLGTRLLGESQAVQFLVQFSVQFSRQVSSLVRRSEEEWSVLVGSEMA
jgi:hypothetical protein